MATTTANTKTSDTAKKNRKTTDIVTQKAKEAQRVATDKAVDAARATSEALDANPLGALAGALAAGAVAAALIPLSRRESDALGPFAAQLRGAVEDAVEAAKEAGSGELTAAGLTIAAASDGLGGVMGKVVKAAGVSASAAATSVKQARTAKTNATPRSDAAMTSNEPMSQQPVTIDA